MRLRGKIAIVVGAGQGPGEGLGNGRATALLFAREGAAVLAVDRDRASAEQTVAMIGRDPGADARPAAVAHTADVTSEADMAGTIDAAMARWGRIDVLHYNVGVSLAAGDAPLDKLTAAAFDRVNTINLYGYIAAARAAIPIMRQQQSGVILGISSVAALATDYPYVVYKTSKAGMIAFTEQIAAQNADAGVRANVILPGLMDTPMAVDTRARQTGRPRSEIAAERDTRVPLRRKMGTAWDIAYAALYLASDEAAFVTGVTLPVDGGALLRVGA